MGRTQLHTQSLSVIVEPEIMNAKALLATFLSLLFLVSCNKSDEPEPEELNGEFVIAGESYGLQVSQKLSFGLPTELRDIRLLFFSKPYPIEAVDVENLHMIGIDIMIMNDEFIGNYEVTGDSSLNSIIYAYGGTNLTLKDQELISGKIYEFEDGELSITKNGDEYQVEINLIDSEAGMLTGNYKGRIR